MTDNEHRLKLRISAAYVAAERSCSRTDFALFHALVAADNQPLPHWSAVSREG